MLELKELTLTAPSGFRSSQLSLVALPGEVVAAVGAPGNGKTLFLNAVMGLYPIAEGFITLDGEPVCAGAGEAFRRFTGYVPQRLPEWEGTVGELVQLLFDMKVCGKQAPGRADVEAVWTSVGIAKDWWNKPWNAAADAPQRELLLGACSTLHRSLVLVDMPPLTQVAATLLRRMADDGAVVVYTHHQPSIAYNKLLNF